MLNSDELRLFLAVLREGNMLAAARRVGVDHSTVARRLTNMEATLGARRFDRSPSQLGRGWRTAGDQVPEGREPGGARRSGG